MHNLRFLGGASIEGPEGPVVGPAVQPRRLAFLAYLAVAKGQPVSRDKLIALLWPGNAPESARHSVRDTVYVLNHELKNAPVEVVGSGLRIDPERCPSDVAAFQTAIESGDLERAVESYGGGFLDGLFLKDALEFEEWARERRGQFARAYAQALEALAEQATQRGDHLQAASRWRDVVAHDPYSGRATARLMESLAAAADRAEALRQADAYALRLREEFDAAPDRTVIELANRLREESTGVVEAREPSTIPDRKARFLAPLAVAALMLGVTVWYMTLRNTETGPELATASIDARAIAVLPFSVQGEDVAVLREGMVDLLSTGLDGAGGLRTIPAGTLMARWRESVASDETPELATALSVARQTGARYALVGSVVAIDSDVRIVVDIYDPSTDERLGQAQVDGSPDDVLPLVDRLAVEVLRVVLERGEEELPEIDLASLTTESPAALQAFLEGEVHFRHFDLTAAEKAYKRAVEADSTFARAHYQLSKVYQWTETRNQTLSVQHIKRAVQLSDRLPVRQALLVRGFYAVWHQTPEVTESLRRAVETYPDDAEAWYLLGEILYHRHAEFATVEELDHAFGRAVELDPRNAEYLRHYVDFAWRVDGDSSRAAQRLELLERVSPKSRLGRGGRLALDLAFGDSMAQEKAMTQLRSEEDRLVVGRVLFLLAHPRYVAFQPVLRLLYERSDDNSRTVWARILFSTNAGWYGQLQKALPYLDDPAMSAGSRAQAAYVAFEAGLPMPEGALEQALDPALIDSTSSVFAVFYAGAFAADRRRWSDHARAVAELERRAARALGEADSSRAVQDVGGARALRGYALWRKGQLAAALPLLEDHRALNPPWFVVPQWLGRLYLELGRFQDAERVYRSHDIYSARSSQPLNQRQLARIYEQLEEYSKAIESYRYFVHHWRDADPELQPMVEEARQALLRLEGMRR